MGRVREPDHRTIPFGVAPVLVFRNLVRMFLGLKPRMFVRSLLLGVLAATAVQAPAHPGTGIVVDGKGQVFFVHGERGQR